jgi:cytoskeletal protein RodZ
VDEPATSGTDASHDADVATAPAASPVPPGDGAAAADAMQATGPAVATDPAVAQPALPLPPGHVSLTFSFAADSWIEIYDGSGKAVLYDLGRAGSQRTIAAAAPLSVTFGNGSAVTLAVNGRAVPVPVPAGQTVARFQVETDGSLR